jgi:crotonobetainyl-CoA:carnitine CoA-transferase CaiB-like acyl-CoA transferase
MDAESTRSGQRAGEEVAMQGACSGLRVLDASRTAGGSLAAMVLADFGADVVRVERSDHPVDTSDPAYLLLQRGKRSIRLDVGAPEGRDDFARLASGCDVLIEDWGPDQADSAGVGYADLSGVNPALVFCSLSGFGTTGPFAGVPADDALVMAKAGIFRDQPGWERDGKRPIYRAARDGSFFIGMLAVQGVLAALRARDLTGRGQRVETNMLQAITCRQNPQVRWLLRGGESLPVDQTSSTEKVSDAINPLAHHRDPREVTLTGMMVECKDGRWIMHSLSEPHFFPAWIKAIGFDWIWEEERFNGAPTRFPDDAAKVELVERLQARMREKTAHEWFELYLANGNVCADVIQTTQEALQHPQVIAADDVVVIDDPRVGRMVQIGPIAKLPHAPASVQRAAPEPGQHTDAVLRETVAPVRLPAPSCATLAGPLEGITIVEAAYYYATPFATALLAELGARVIKVEPLHGDPYRRLGRGGGDPVASIGYNNMVRAMQGKESIALDLKDARGRAVMHRLIAGADLFVHSFRGQVPETLGIDEATLRAVNPHLVYQYAASYGSVGPYRRQPAIDPVIAAFAGQTEYQTGAGNPPLRESGADPVAAAGHAAAMMLGLYARHRSGAGQSVESAMIVSNIYLNFADALAYANKPPRPYVDRRQFGIGATHRLYECAPSGSADASPHANRAPKWVMLVADDDAAFGRFCQVAGRSELAADPRFSNGAARVEHRDELEQLLERVFLERTAGEWQTILLAEAVGCVIADAMSHFAFLYEDPQALAIDMMTITSHRALGGEYWRYSPLVRLSDTPGRALPFCEFGEHSRALLTEFGYTDAEVERLASDGVVAEGVGAPTPATRT